VAISWWSGHFLIKFSIHQKQQDTLSSSTMLSLAKLNSHQKKATSSRNNVFDEVDILMMWMFLDDVLQDVATQQPYFDYLTPKFTGKNLPNIQFIGQSSYLPCNNLGPQSDAQCRNLSTNSFPYRIDIMCRVTPLTIYVLCADKLLRQWTIFLHSVIPLINKYGKNFMNPYANIRSKMQSAMFFTTYLLLAYTKAGKPQPWSISTIYQPIWMIKPYIGLMCYH